MSTILPLLVLLGLIEVVVDVWALSTSTRRPIFWVHYAFVFAAVVPVMLAMVLYQLDASSALWSGLSLVQNAVLISLPAWLLLWRPPLPAEWHERLNRFHLASIMVVCGLAWYAAVRLPEVFLEEATMPSAFYWRSSVGLVGAALYLAYFWIMLGRRGPHVGPPSQGAPGAFDGWS